MRFVLLSKRMIAPIIVIGLLTVALTLVCSEGVHTPISGNMDRGCAVMSHSGLATGTLGSESTQTLISQLMVIGLGAVLAMFMLVSPVRTSPVIAAPSPPPDSRFGRLRI